MKSQLCTSKKSPEENGFTVLELMVVVSILAVVSLIAVPKVQELLEGFDKRDAQMALLQDLRLAQATTVEQGCQGILKIASDLRGYTYGCDYVPFSTVSPPAWDATKFTRRLDSNVRISADNVIIFNSRGQVIDETGALTSRTITMSVAGNGTPTTFNTGTLRATGFFSFAN